MRISDWSSDVCSSDLPKVAAKYAGVFPQLNLVTIGKDFGSWKAAQVKYFNDGGVFDKIFATAKHQGHSVMDIALSSQLQMTKDANHDKIGREKVGTQVTNEQPVSRHLLEKNIQNTTITK